MGIIWFLVFILKSNWKLLSSVGTIIHFIKNSTVERFWWNLNENLWKQAFIKCYAVKQLFFSFEFIYCNNNIITVFLIPRSQTHCVNAWKSIFNMHGRTLMVLIWIVYLKDSQSACRPTFACISIEICWLLVQPSRERRPVVYGELICIQLNEYFI